MRDSQSKCAPIVALAAIALGCCMLTFESRAYAQSAQVQGTGGIRGTVLKDVDNLPLSDSTVTAYRVSPPPAFSAQSFTGEDGAFTIAGLPKGEYELCVKTNNAALVNPCEWRDLHRPISVADGKTTPIGSVLIRATSVVRIHLNDPGQNLQKKAGEARPPHVLVGVMDVQGLFHPAIEKDKTGAGADYELAAPMNVPLRLWLASAQVQLTNERDAPLPGSGHSEVFVLKQGQAGQKTFTFNVVGRRP